MNNQCKSELEMNTQVLTKISYTNFKWKKTHTNHTTEVIAYKKKLMENLTTPLNINFLCCARTNFEMGVPTA